MANVIMIVIVIIIVLVLLGLNGVLGYLFFGRKTKQEPKEVFIIMKDKPFSDFNEAKELVEKLNLSVATKQQIEQAYYYGLLSECIRAFSDEGKVYTINNIYGEVKKCSSGLNEDSSVNNVNAVYVYGVKPIISKKEFTTEEIGELSGKLTEYLPKIYQDEKVNALPFSYNIEADKVKLNWSIMDIVKN